MTKPWLARQMRPGLDTVATMALHYGLTPSRACDIIRTAGAEVTREDGHRGKLAMVTTLKPADGDGVMLKKSRVTGWSDGAPVKPETTRLTRSAIVAVCNWAIRQRSNNGEDS